MKTRSGGTWFARLSLKGKLLLIILGVTSIALTLSSVGLLLNERVTLRNASIDNLAILAEVIGSNSSAALAFQDQVVATETLSALQANPHILSACIYNELGIVFVQYQRPGVNESCPAVANPEAGFSSEAGFFTLFHPIVLGERSIGTVYMRSDTLGLNQLLRNFLLVSALLFLGTFLVAFALSAWLQGFITAPISHLVATMRKVSQERNYAIRATKETDDEMGVLVDGFNEMLEAIQSSEEALTHYTEELERSNKELDDFAYIASHDLKEPLRGIHNFSNILMAAHADQLDERGVSKLQTLARLTQRMETLINSLLYYSRVGRTELAILQTNLDAVVAEVLESLQIRLKEENVEVRIPKPLPVVRCDRIRIAEVYRNLVTNAIKYNDKEERWIELGFAPALDDPTAYVYYVKDNGIGIQEKHQETIFQIFKRLHGRDQYGGGTGIGMTIIKKIIERHEGRIWLTSTYGEGTTFYFTLHHAKRATHAPAAVNR